jgi:hypothetical protein
MRPVMLRTERIGMYASIVAKTPAQCYSEDRRVVSATPRPPMGQRRIFTSMRIRLFPHRISTTTRMRMASSPMSAVPLRQGTPPGHPGTPRPGARATRRHVVSSFGTHQAAIRMCAKKRHRPTMRAKSEQIVSGPRIARCVR